MDEDDLGADSLFDRFVPVALEIMCKVHVNYFPTQTKLERPLYNMHICIFRSSMPIPVMAPVFMPWQRKQLAEQLEQVHCPSVSYFLSHFQ